eukprot:scaffold116394_cov38-Prasinocladus_malaysianus.AAC.1
MATAAHICSLKSEGPIRSSLTVRLLACGIVRDIRHGLNECVHNTVCQTPEPRCWAVHPLKAMRMKVHGWRKVMPCPAAASGTTPVDNLLITRGGTRLLGSI